MTEQNAIQSPRFDLTKIAKSTCFFGVCGATIGAGLAYYKVKNVAVGAFNVGVSCLLLSGIFMSIREGLRLISSENPSSQVNMYASNFLAGALTGGVFHTAFLPARSILISSTLSGTTAALIDAMLNQKPRRSKNIVQYTCPKTLPQSTLVPLAPEAFHQVWQDYISKKSLWKWFLPFFDETERDLRKHLNLHIRTLEHDIGIQYARTKKNEIFPWYALAK